MMVKMSIISMLTALSYLFSTTCATAFSPAKLRARQSSDNSMLDAPPPPSQDPFYTAPPGFEDAAPGQVLRVREASGLAQIVGNSSAAYNLLYRTTDSNYGPAWAVTTIFVPQASNDYPTTDGASGANILSFQYAYDSANVNESPSWTPYRDAGTVDPSVPRALSEGWFVNVPDYEGPLASFCAGVQSGHAVIDSIRAVLNYGEQIGIDATAARYAMWGYSGGALASEWASELQVQYAPEMNFAGVALGGLTPNITSVLLRVNEGVAVVLIPNGIIGITSQDEAARNALDSSLRQEGEFNATGFYAARNQTFFEGALYYAGQNIFDYFTNGDEIIRDPATQALTNRDGIMGYHGVPSMPVFVYQAIGDDISPIENTDKLIERYCAVGPNIWFQRNTVGNHGSEDVNGFERALSFLSSVFDGSYNNTGCRVEDVTIDLSESA